MIRKPINRKIQRAKEYLLRNLEDGYYFTLEGLSRESGCRKADFQRAMMEIKKIPGWNFRSDNMRRYSWRPTVFITRRPEGHKDNESM